jgi:urease accessory protein UreF
VTPYQKDFSQGLEHVYKDSSLFKSERLNTYTKLTVYKSLIKSVMTYACPTWKHMLDAHFWKTQRLQNRVLNAAGNLDRHTPVHEFHVAFKIPYARDYVTRLCRT